MAAMRNRDKFIVFDMDGTLFDFYGVENWKEYLDVEHSVFPYLAAKPLYDPDVLNPVIKELRNQGWTIIVCSWLSQYKTYDFHEQIRRAKIKRLKEIAFPYDFLIMTDYGTDKQACIKNFGGIQVLVDDSDEVLSHWNGRTIDAKHDIMPGLMRLIRAYEYDVE
jgi:hypothetical protein